MEWRRSANPNPVKTAIKKITAKPFNILIDICISNKITFHTSSCKLQGYKRQRHETLNFSNGLSNFVTKLKL
jgi:hypothetical protein